MMPDARDPLCLAGAVPAAACSRWLDWIGAARARLQAPHPDLQPASASLRLRALGDTAFDGIVAAVRAGPAGPVLRARLGPDLRCLASQCWARRQVPAAQRAPGEHPHEWHQDGALNCRFDGSNLQLLDVVTVWIALVPCGVDAPSLEWIVPGPCGLHPALELADPVLAQRFGLAGRAHARLAAGDALVFGGALLHRSHHDAAMTRPRDSIELRFVPAGPVPPRLAHEHLSTLPD